jgi:hypothetical protein
MHRSDMQFTIMQLLGALSVSVSVLDETDCPLMVVLQDKEKEFKEYFL